MKRVPFLQRSLALLLLVSLTGCGSITGLNAEEDFSCALEIESPCRSTALVYEKSVNGDYVREKALRDEKKRRDREEKNGLLDKVKEKLSGTETTTSAVDAKESPDSSSSSSTPALRDESAPEPGFLARPYDPAVVITHLGARPERLPEEIVAIWIAPWTDAEGDFHEGEKIYARVADARWAAARRRAEESRAGRAVVSLPFVGTKARQKKKAEPEAGESPFGSGALKLQSGKSSYEKPERIE